LISGRALDDTEGDMYLVYDSVLMSAVIPLSEKSIAAGAAPVECPDFTRGKWKTKKPSFAVEG
jgi:hypothetical protein